MNDLLMGHAALKRSFFALWITALLFILTGGGIVIYWNWFDTEPPITYDPAATFTSNINGVQTNTFRAGETLLLSRSFCVTEAVQAVMDRRLVSVTTGDSYGIDTYLLNLRLGCVTNGKRPVTIPPWIPPDTYRLVVTGTYPNNMLKQGTFIPPEVTIKVVP